MGRRRSLQRSCAWSVAVVLSTRESEQEEKTETHGHHSVLRLSTEHGQSASLGEVVEQVTVHLLTLRSATNHKKGSGKVRERTCRASTPKSKFCFLPNGVNSSAPSLYVQSFKNSRSPLAAFH